MTMGAKKQIFQGALCAYATLVAFGALAVEPAGVRTCVDVRRFHDGDTFTCVTEAGPLRIRVAAIDAPEVGQGFWRVSRDLLRSRTPPGSQVDCYKVDRYERQVCRVSRPNKDDVALGLVDAGLAWHSVKYRGEQSPEERAEYAAAEAKAKERRRGLWTQPVPQSPWECRAGKRERIACY